MSFFFPLPSDGTLCPNIEVMQAHLSQDGRALVAHQMCAASLLVLPLSFFQSKNVHNDL